MKTLLNTVKLHVEDLGTNAPALVFLHYWGGSSRTWRHVVQALTPAFRCIAIDQRRWGQSDKPPGAYALDALADDAQGLIDIVRCCAMPKLWRSWSAIHAPQESAN